MTVSHARPPPGRSAPGRPAGVIARYRDWLPVRRHRPGDHPRRGQHPAGPGRDAVRPAGLRGLAQGRGRQPDRLVQGPRDDGRRQRRRRRRAPRRWSARRPATPRPRRRRTPPRPGCCRSCCCRPAGSPTGKLAQAIVHGAKVVQIEGNFDDCLRAGPRAGRRLPGGPGQLGQPGPDRGPEDRGVRDRRRARRRARPARDAGRQRREHLRLLAWLHPVRARPAWPRGRRGCGASRPPAPRRWCSATRCSIPRPWPPRSGSATRPRPTLAVAARDESGGLFEAVTDEQILAAQAFLAAREGVFVEPASAAGVAGLLAKRRARRARRPASRSW